MPFNLENKFKAIGIMSGTSLDGIDVVACEFVYKNKNWEYKIVQGETYTYELEIFKKLLNAPKLNGFELSKLNIEYGQLIGKTTNQFIAVSGFKPDFIASHGYTVFHQPEIGLTLQIGSGAEIAAITRLKTICDFRTVDVALGGNGAPLVPIGDELLFNKYDACLNLGGFSNISFKEKGSRVAYDICPVNILLNYMAEQVGLKYDNDGELGKQGKVIEPLLKKLNNLEYYKKDGPKSLGREFVESAIFPLIPEYDSVYDLLRTFYEHIAIQISLVINQRHLKTVLFTGGGAYNTFLTDLIKAKSKAKIVIPQNQLIDFKEALVFAFLGVLRLSSIPNCLKLVTGAAFDNIGGAVYSSPKR